MNYFKQRKDNLDQLADKAASIPRVTSSMLRAQSFDALLSVQSDNVSCFLEFPKMMPCSRVAQNDAPRNETMHAVTCGQGDTIE